MANRSNSIWLLPDNLDNEIKHSTFIFESGGKVAIYQVKAMGQYQSETAIKYLENGFVRSLDNIGQEVAAVPHASQCIAEMIDTKYIHQKSADKYSQNNLINQLIKLGIQNQLSEVC